jgi:hypothetical protein
VICDKHFLELPRTTCYAGRTQEGVAIVAMAKVKKKLDSYALCILLDHTGCDGDGE